MNIEIREFQPGDQAAFQALNEAWITAYFTLEEKDHAILGDPQTHILDHGGHIYFAIDANTREIVGCCALETMENNCFEVVKMAVAGNLRGQGIGRKLLRAVIEAARALGARRLYIETNHTLKNAIALYRSEGFEHLRPEDVKPTPYVRADVFMERYL
jgi:putative acetyltransferase